MKKESTYKETDELRPEYDLSKLKGGVRGKYYGRARAGTNLVLIEPNLTAVFPDTDSVNRALRLLADTAQAAAGQAQRVRRTKDNRSKRTSGKPAAVAVASCAEQAVVVKDLLCQ
jgi:hypothetical protein